MSIRRKRGLLRHMAENSTACDIQIVSTDPDAAAAALAAAVPDLWAIESSQEPGVAAASYIDDQPIVVPGGPLLYLDLSEEVPEVLERFVEVLEHHLAEHGVDDAVIGCVTGKSVSDALYGHPWSGEWRYPPGVSLRMASYRDPEIDAIPAAAWLDALVAWTLEIADDDALWCEVVGNEFPVPTGSAAAVVRPLLGDRSCGLRAGRVKDVSRIWSISNEGDAVRLLARGPLADLGVEADALRNLARLLAPHVEHAAIEFQAAAIHADFPDETPNDEDAAAVEQWWIMPPGGVPDAYWWQVLDPATIDRIGGPPPGAVPLEAGRWELEIGDRQEWMQHGEARSRRRLEGRQRLERALNPDGVYDNTTTVPDTRRRQWKT